MASLLEKAKSTKLKRLRRTYTDEELDLVKAWLKGEIVQSQVDAAMDFSGSSSCYSFLALGAKELVRRGKL